MNKTELVDAVAAKTLLSKKDSEKALAAVIETISESLIKGERVALVGFGTFEVRERAARKCRNPITKKEIMVPASKVPAFKPGKSLKEEVNH